MGSRLSGPKHRVEPEEARMPFWKKDKEEGNKEKVNYKARLEHKQYLAQESPEPVYDLTDCGMKNVPSGVFSRCKISRKQALLLQDNELVSLSGGGNLYDLSEISLLDLHNNALEKLPEEIGLLVKLTSLNLQDNKLKALPSSIGSLKNLKTLNLSGNCLKELPVLISGLGSLTLLDLRRNPKLKRIPPELARCSRLESLLLDEASLSYPSTDLARQGTEAVMRFLCKECDIEYKPPGECDPVEVVHTNGNTKNLVDPFQDVVSNHLAKAEKIKEEKRRQAFQLEQQLMEAQEKEARLKMQSVESKKKLLDDIVQEETKKSAEVVKIQRMKEEERNRLFLSMVSVEKQTDLLINELMASSQRYSDPKKVMEALEAERKEMEKRFTIQQQDVDKLKEKEVLRAMQMTMEVELQREATRRQYEQRKGVIQSALNSTLDNDKAIEAVLQTKGKQQDELISKLLEDEKYQREAFQSLLLQQDHRSQEISEQMERIQSELGSLTMLEMKKRDMKMEFELEVLKEKRDMLTKMLLELMDKKKQRAEDLQELLGEMERGRSAQQENYWLIQYQKLLDSKPQGVFEDEKSMDPQVRALLLDCGAEKLGPLLARKRVTFKQMLYADHKTLLQLGVENEEVRTRLLLGAERLANRQNGAPPPASAPHLSLDDTAATAPLNEEEEEEGEHSVPSAPSIIDTFHSAECVVCLERSCDIVFLPCGHLCSCSQCESPLEECPLCRAQILQRLRLR